MIEGFRRIGEEISKEFKEKSEIDREKSILDCLAIEPETNSREIKLIFDLDKKGIDIEIGDSEFRKGDNLFCFDVGGNTPSIFLGSNNFYYHVGGTIPYLSKKLPEKMKEFKEFIKNIKKDFYIDVNVKGKKKLEKKYLLNIGKFIETELNNLKAQKEKFPENKKFIKKIEGEINKVQNIIELFNKAKQKVPLEGGKYKKLIKFFEEIYLKNKIENYNAKNFNINKIYFKQNNEIKDISNTKYWQEYVQVCYHHKIGIFFNEKEKGIKEEKIDFLTNIIDKITNNVSLKIRFYTTTNNIYFENCESKNAYKSFTVSQKTFEQLLLGTDYVYRKLKLRLGDFGLNYLVIPKSETFVFELKKNTEELVSELKNISNKVSGQQKDLEEKKRIKKYSDRRNWKFDLMFYEKDKSSFNVYKIINDLSYFNLKKIKNAIISVNDKSEFIRKYLKTFENHNFNLNSIWNLYYSWTKHETFKDKRKIYRSEMLDLLESIYTLRKQEQKRIFRKILYNLKKNYFKNKNLDEELILNTINYLNFVLNLNMMENKDLGENREMYTKKISNEDLEEYFNINKKIFAGSIENGVEKQGLTLLGYFISKIVWEQFKKKKSKTFIDKINFEGIKKEKLDKFILQVIEYLEIYKQKVYNEPELFVEMQERLNYIKDSNLTKEEIVYYILLGTFLGKYIGIKRGSQKKDDETNKNSESLEEIGEEDGN